MAEEEDEVAVSPWAKGFGLLWTAVALLTIFTYWQGPNFLNLASSFRVQLLLALVVVSLPPLVLFPGKRKLLFVAIPALIGFTFLSHYFQPVEVGDGSEIRVSLANVWSGNRDLGALKAWLEKTEPDHLGILEVAPHHIEQLQALGYSAILAEPREGNFGLAYLSRVEPIRMEVLEMESPFPSILAEYDDYQVVVTHPVPPLRKEARQWGDEQTMRLGKFIENSEKPTILMGDLNATDWDRRVEPLKKAGLRNARQGFGILTTWPTHQPILSIPIDHVYVPKEWGVKLCEVGPAIGSDHYPIRAVIAKPTQRT